MRMSHNSYGGVGSTPERGERGGLLRLEFLRPGFQAEIHLSDGPIVFSVTNTITYGAGYQSEQPRIVPFGTLDPAVSDYRGAVYLEGVRDRQIDPSCIRSGDFVLVHEDPLRSYTLGSPVTEVTVYPSTADPEVVSARRAHAAQSMNVSTIGSMLGLRLAADFSQQYDTEGLESLTYREKDFVARYGQYGKSQELKIYEAEGYWTKIQYYGASDWLKVSSAYLRNNAIDRSSGPEFIPDAEVLLRNNAPIVTSSTSERYMANSLVIDVPARLLLESIAHTHLDGKTERLPSDVTSNLAPSAQFSIEGDWSAISILPEDGFFAVMENVVPGITERVSESSTVSTLLGSERPLVALNNRDLISLAEPAVVLSGLIERFEGYQKASQL